MKMDKMSSRPIRNRKQNRRSWSPADIQRPTVKRLFTPDIKRMLKDWLIRRRENPYPSRDEKKSLAYETGLTYTQICNWFANWRRKLKNSGKEPAKKSWGNLIKNYNTSALGNVEQFSITSGDSIWKEQKLNKNKNYVNPTSEDESTNCSSCEDITNINTINNIKNNGNNINEYNFLISNLVNNSSNTSGKYSDSYDDTNLKLNDDKFISGITKYKHQMIEKYYTDSNNRVNDVNLLNSPRTSSTTTASTASSPELSKWLESTANFQPNKKNYIEWNMQRDKLGKKNENNQLNLSNENLNLDTFHQKEIEAAEALANLWNESRQRFNQNNTSNNNINNGISACS